MAGYGASETLGKEFPLVFSGRGSVGENGSRRRALAQGSQFAGQLLAYKDDGKPFWVQLHISPISADGAGVPPSCHGFQ
ncbi:PAS domain-containing protein [Caballeronia temeraria]|uniref:PAS domain-containing protein n=1 Tax=Caballeronia temeraria TaxID=1777137 RepID=UPI0009EF372D